MTWAPFVAALDHHGRSRATGRCSCAGRRSPARRSRSSRRSGSTGPTTAPRPASSSSEEFAARALARASLICFAIDGMSALMCAAHVDHHLRRRLRVVDSQGAQPGVLRAAAAPGHRRLRRLRVARPVRLLPVLRDRRAADVPAHRHLGLVGRRPAAGHLRLGDGTHRRRHEGIRRDEADAVPALRVGVHPRRHPRALRRRRVAHASHSWRSRRCSSIPRCSRGCSWRSTSASASSPASGRSTRGRPTATRRRRRRSRCCTPAC